MRVKTGKNGAVFANINPAMIRVITAADSVWEAQLRLEPVITSGTDGYHRPKSGRPSLHYSGRAFDLRTWDREGHQLTYPAKTRLANALRNHLDSDFDVIVEDTHIHVEYDPKDLK